MAFHDLWLSEVIRKLDDDPTILSRVPIEKMKIALAMARAAQKIPLLEKALTDTLSDLRSKRSIESAARSYLRSLDTLKRTDSADPYYPLEAEQLKFREEVLRFALKEKAIER